MSIGSFYYPTLSTLPAARERSSFVGTTILWILSNPILTPTDYKIRAVVDRGSIQESIGEEVLFDREIDVNQTQTLPLKIIKTAVSRIAQAAALFGGIPVAACLGTVWHLGNSVYYTVSWIKKGEQPKELAKHANALLIDSIIPLFICAIAYDCLKAQKSVFTMSDREMQALPFGQSLFAISLASSLAMAGMGAFVIPVALVAGVLPQMLCQVVCSSAKPIHLKEHFGVVGQNGWLLTDDRVLDREEGKVTNDGEVQGLFGSLCQKKINEMLMEARSLIDAGALRFNDADIERFSENFKTFLDYLNTGVGPQGTGLGAYSKEDLQIRIDRFTKCREKYEEMNTLLQESLPSSKRITFSSDRAVKTSFTYRYFCEAEVAFRNAVRDGKNHKFSKRTAPNDCFRETQERVLSKDGFDPYNILGIPFSSDLETCRKQLNAIRLKVASDKLTTYDPTIQRDGDRLLNIVHLAYEAIVAEKRDANPNSDSEEDVNVSEDNSFSANYSDPD